jgi:hypothetical protein
MASAVTATSGHCHENTAGRLGAIVRDRVRRHMR